MSQRPSVRPVPVQHVIVLARNRPPSKPGALSQSPTSRRAGTERAAAASALAAAQASLCLCHARASGDSLLLTREAIVGPGRAVGGVAGAHHALPHGCALKGKAGAGMHHRRAPGVDGGDDLLRGDSLQEGAGRGEVRVPQLALDQRQWAPLVQQLDSMRMAKLVRSEAPADAGRKRGGVARAGRRWPTRRARQWVRRSRRTKGRPAKRPARPATVRAPSTPTRPSRPGDGDRSSHA